MPESDATIAPAALSELAERMCALFEDGAPAVLRGVGEPFSLSEVFDWIRRVHPAEREKASRRKIRALKEVWHLQPPEAPDRTAASPGRPAELYREGAMLLDATPHLPGPTDADFDAWVARTREALGGDFGMQAPCLECASWDALERLQRLLAPTLRLTGPRSYRYNAFLGDYRRTPFGFHVDPHHEAVFQYVVHGRRRGMFWEGLVLGEDDAAWVEDGTGRVTPRIEPEVVFELEPGDLVFWPGTHVHGFETEGPSAALSMVLDRTSPRDRASIVAGLEVQTMGGRAALPAVDTGAEVGLDDELERRAAHRLGYERYDDELIVGVCGRTFDWPDRLSVTSAMRLLDFVEERPRVRVREAVEGCRDQWLEPEEILGVLSMLVGLGYLRRR